VTTELLERDASWAQLNEALKEAAGGQGRLILVSSEAGVGKTSLVNSFTKQTTRVIRILWRYLPPGRLARCMILPSRRKAS
jgi:predicted ATPase